MTKPKLLTISTMLRNIIHGAIGTHLNDDDLQQVATVFLHHPMCECLNDEQKLERIWNVGGMKLITGMLPTARERMELKMQQAELKEQLSEINQKLEQNLEYGKNWF